MKKTILILILATLISSITSAQEIDMKLTIFGYQFKQNETKLSWKEVLEKTKNNKNAYLLIKKGKSQNTISTILAFTGGLLVGIPVATSIHNDKTDWNLAYIGVAIVATGLPLAISSVKNTRKGIDLYNSSLNDSTTFKFNPEFYFITTRDGIGISMNF
jgi:hypothetical protein